MLFDLPNQKSGTKNAKLKVRTEWVILPAVCKQLKQKSGN